MTDEPMSYVCRRVCGCVSQVGMISDGSESFSRWLAANQGTTEIIETAKVRTMRWRCQAHECPDKSCESHWDANGSPV